MVLQKIYVQYRYGFQEYFLPNANIGVDGDSFYEECTSAFDGISTGCGFNLIEGHIYDTAATKDGYYLTAESLYLDFTAPVEPYILLWLFPREPSVTTLDATNVTSNSATLNGELTDLDGVEATDVCLLYGKVGESYTVSTEWTHYEPDTFSYNITGLAPDTTYNFKTRANNITEEDTFYVFGETKQFTTTAAAEPPVVYTYDTDEISSTSALLCGYLGTSGGIPTDIGFEYGETTSYGTTVWTDAFESPGHYTEAITGLDPDTLYHVRAIAENNYGTGYGVDTTFTTLGEVAPPEVTATYDWVDNNVHINWGLTSLCTTTNYNLGFYKKVDPSDEWAYLSDVNLPQPQAATTLTGTEVIDGSLVDANGIEILLLLWNWDTSEAATYMSMSILREVTYNMGIILPNANGKLFLNNTIIACDEPADACTEFRFLVMNTGDVTASAWYSVSIVGSHDPLYAGTIPNLAPGVGSSYIDDWICALPGGLPVGTHTVKVEVGIEGSTTATDTYTEDIFVIPEPEPPDVSTLNTSSITQTSATLNGNLTSTSGGTSTHIGFEYGKTTSYGTTVWDKYTSSTGFYAEDATSLTPNTTYHVRAIAENNYGTGYGVDMTFTTLPTIDPPEVRTLNTKNIAQTSATLYAALLYTGDVSTHVGFEYGETTSYGTTVWDQYTPTPNWYEKDVIGLSHNTTYHVRAIVSNAYGTDYGSDKTFTTLSATVDITFIATAPGISDLHDVDVNDVTDPGNPLYLGKT